MTIRVSLMGVSVLAFVSLGALPVAAQAVDFGNDSSIWAMDGECDDPRFMGAGMASNPQDADILADASDCRAAFDAGTITVDPARADAQVPADRQNMPSQDMPSDTEGVIVPGDIDFGTDTSPWAMDGECDDPRFFGPGMAASPQDSDVLADATDCMTLYQSGMVDIIEGSGTQPQPSLALDFGTDTSPWSNDGECDDPRFFGEGMAAQPQDSDLFADATDCRTLFEAGLISLADGTGMEQMPTDVDFGADTGQWTFDGECDDPRFEGQGMASVLLDEDRFADATDCRALYEAGSIRLVGEGVQDIPDGEIDFGSDSGAWTNDGECDDPRFAGEGMAAVLVDADRFADATDCRQLFEAGMISYIGDGDGGGATNTATVDFGSDSGQWTFDGECDDPRFEGNGMAAVLVDADRFADATDCRTLYEAGQITYIGD
jgi:hypothetical protein